MDVGCLQNARRVGFFKNLGVGAVVVYQVVGYGVVYRALDSDSVAVVGVGQVGFGRSGGYQAVFWIVSVTDDGSLSSDRKGVAVVVPGVGVCAFGLDPVIGVVGVGGDATFICFREAVVERIVGVKNLTARVVRDLVAVTVGAQLIGVAGDQLAQRV